LARTFDTCLDVIAEAGRCVKVESPDGHGGEMDRTVVCLWRTRVGKDPGSITALQADQIRDGNIGC
jgi:hypothetical protein